METQDVNSAISEHPWFKGEVDPEVVPVIVLFNERGKRMSEQQAEPQSLPLLTGTDDYEPCNVAGVNGSGEWERCICEKGHEGPHAGMGSD